MKPNGKDICHALKTIRKQVAEANGIDYTPATCHHDGECSGTCPCCEAEVRYIETQLGALRLAGKAVKVAGLALGLTMATGYSQSSVASTRVLPTAYAQKKNTKTRNANSHRRQNTVPEKTETAQVVDTAVVNIEDTCAHDLPEIAVTACVPVSVLSYTGSVSTVKRLVKNPQHIYDKPDVAACFKGGDEAMKLFFVRNMRITPIMNEVCAQGYVRIQCIVEGNGRLTEIRVIRSIEPHFDAEALRLVRMMPRWKPARVEGQRVRTRVVISVPFKFQ